MASKKQKPVRRTAPPSPRRVRAWTAKVKGVRVRIETDDTDTIWTWSDVIATASVVSVILTRMLVGDRGKQVRHG